MFRLHRARCWLASAFLFVASLHTATHAVAANCWDADRPDSLYSLDGPAGTVVDTSNNLMWKQCLEGQSGADCATGAPTRMLWDDANNAATASRWAGYSDWRMPTRLEYRTLRAISCNGLTVNPTVFPRDPAMPIWIGEQPTIPRLAWVVTQGGGFAQTDRATVSNPFRLVRSGPPPSAQTLAFGPMPFLTLGGTATVSASNPAVAQSGKAVRYSSATPSVCTVDAVSGVVTLTPSAVAGNTCTLAADQYGGINNGVTYSQAAQVTQDLTVATNCWDGDKPDAQYSLAGPVGTVVDTTSNLMWKQCVQGLSDVACTGTPSFLNWAAGKAAATASTDGGYNDWRLPSRAELESLVPATCAAFPSKINETRFPNAPGMVTWTGELDAADATRAWYVGFDVGFALTHNITNTGFVRLVRSGWPGVLLPTAQTLVFGVAPVLRIGGTATVNAVNAAVNNGTPHSGNAVRYRSNTPTVCSVDPGTGQVTLAGDAAVGNTCTIAADQYGRVNAAVNYAPAAQLTQDLVVVKGNQSLSFTRPLPTPALGNGGTVNATSSSGLTGIAYASTTPTVCTIGPASGVIAVLSAGLCTLTADLGVSANYFAAPQINQDFTVAPALGSAAAPFTGNTVPPAGAGAPASASFTSATGGPACRFDPANTAFVASPAPYPAPGSIQPQGAFKFKLIGCNPGFSAQISVTWPSLVGTSVLKYGKASALAPSNSFFAPLALSIVGNTATYTVTDGQLGDDDWLVDGAISDPLVPVALPIAPVPTLGQWGLLLLAGLLAALGGLRAWGSRTQRRRYLLSM